MTSLGTPLTARAARVMLLGAGELGKEVALELQRFGAEVIAVDRYEHAPAMQVAHRSHVIDMLNPTALRMLLLREQPDVILPEIEAIATGVLVDFEQRGRGRAGNGLSHPVGAGQRHQGGEIANAVATDTAVLRHSIESSLRSAHPAFPVQTRHPRVAPTARAVQLTMDREGIRRLAAEDLAIPTSPYRFVDSLADLEIALGEIGMPCVVKPVQSSSGKGQTVIPSYDDAQHRAAVSQGLGTAVLDHQFAWARKAWEHAQFDGRGANATDNKPVRVIVEGFVEFDYEITLLTVRSACSETGETVTTFCPPIGHIQESGDYRESWTPAAMTDAALAKAQDIAHRVTEALGGWGVFGVELFIKGDDVLFNEVSPRPHDTGLVTLVGQDVSEFGLHARAVLGLPVQDPVTIGGPDQAFSASCAVLATGSGVPVFDNVDAALAIPTAQVRLFGKPRVDGTRRVGVTLARGATIDEARTRAREAAASLTVRLV